MLYRLYFDNFPPAIAIANAIPWVTNTICRVVNVIPQIVGAIRQFRNAIPRVVDMIFRVISATFKVFLIAKMEILRIIFLLYIRMIEKCKRLW